MGGSPGLVVMGGDSCYESRGFESQHCILDGHFSHLFVVKIVMFVWKDENQMKKRPGLAIFLKKNYEKIFLKKHLMITFQTTRLGCTPCTQSTRATRSCSTFQRCCPSRRTTGSSCRERDTSATTSWRSSSRWAHPFFFGLKRSGLACFDTVRETYWIRNFFYLTAIYAAKYARSEQALTSNVCLWPMPQ